MTFEVLRSVFIPDCVATTTNANTIISFPFQSMNMKMKSTHELSLDFKVHKTKEKCVFLSCVCACVFAVFRFYSSKKSSSR